MMAKHSDLAVTDTEPADTTGTIVAEPPPAPAAAPADATASAVHSLAAMRHDPAAIRHLFESGE
jgi:hypothetical protein